MISVISLLFRALKRHGAILSSALCLALTPAGRRLIRAQFHRSESQWRIRTVKRFSVVLNRFLWLRFTESFPLKQILWIDFWGNPILWITLSEPFNSLFSVLSHDVARPVSDLWCYRYLSFFSLSLSFVEPVVFVSMGNVHPCDSYNLVQIKLRNETPVFLCGFIFLSTLLHVNRHVCYVGGLLLMLLLL